jgi:(p)ppGpp synthase/HD superfamily hydrolase
MAPDNTSDGAAAIFAAVRFAADAHSGQFRKGSRVPYLVHPLNVAKILIDHGCSDDLAIAGLLHDTVEDTEVTVEEIRTIFGDTVARLVEFVTEPKTLWTWEKRKQHTLAVLNSGEAPVLLLSIADKLDNIRSIRSDLGLRGEKAWEHFKRPREKQRWYYQSLSRIFDARLVDSPGLELAAEFHSEVEAVFGPE